MQATQRRECVGDLGYGFERASPPYTHTHNKRVSLESRIRRQKVSLTSLSSVDMVESSTRIVGGYG